MRRRMCVGVVLVLLSAPTGGAQSTAKRGTEATSAGRAQSVEEAERAFSKARDNQDEAAVKRMLHTDFMWVNRSGEVAKMEEWMKLPAIPPSDVTDQEVRIHGDTAVRTAIVNTTMDGKQARFRIVRVWTQDDGAWKLLHHQSTGLAQSAAKSN